MVTIYDLLEVKEDSSKEEIEQSYQKLILEYKINPNLSEQENKENEMILNKLKIAYEIVMDDEKRKKYDNDLAKKRAEELIENVVVDSNEEESEKIQSKNITSNEFQNDDNSLYDNYQEDDDSINSEDEEVVLTKEEQEKVRKAAEKEFKQNLKKAQKVEEEYNQAYNKAYNDYLNKIGYQSRQGWTLKKVRDIVIVLAVTILVCFIAWHIPPVKKMLVDLYKGNFIIKSLVDLVLIFIKSITSIFK